jgi:hypothetical protein
MFTTAELDILEEILDSKAAVKEFLGEKRMKGAVEELREGKGG